MAKKQGNLNLPKFRINEEIYGNYDVRITGEGIESRVLPLKEAKAIAESMELDLIEINPSTQPPIMKIASYDIVFQDVPGEVTLSLNLSQCPNRCPGCHSPLLQDDIGLLLDDDMLDEMLEDVAVPESQPRDDGNKTIVILKKK